MSGYVPIQCKVILIRGAIALALERVVPLSGQMGAAARARAEERLSWSRVARQVLSVLEDAIVRRAVSGQKAA